MRTARTALKPIPAQWSPTAELYAELRLLSVEEAEAERRWHLRR
jgi:hypothetical protein